jgi:hypothetical protein
MVLLVRDADRPKMVQPFDFSIDLTIETIPSRFPLIPPSNRLD